MQPVSTPQCHNVQCSSPPACGCSPIDATAAGNNTNPTVSCSCGTCCRICCHKACKVHNQLCLQCCCQPQCGKLSHGSTVVSTAGFLRIATLSPFAIQLVQCTSAAACACSHITVAAACSNTHPRSLITGGLHELRNSGICSCKPCNILVSTSFACFAAALESSASTVCLLSAALLLLLVPADDAFGPSLLLGAAAAAAAVLAAGSTARL